MSITTKRGDLGETRLNYNRPVRKSHSRVAAYGTVDELNSALGMARCQCDDTEIKSVISSVQDQLVTLMGELATESTDRKRYLQDGFTVVDEAFVAVIDDLVADLESRGLSFKGWAKPGDHPLSSILDMARCVCRRAECQVCCLLDNNFETNTNIQRYLNRLSDALWLLARWIEAQTKQQSPGKR
ncbi:MAG: Cob(I)yrinic acid a,c-diamide adenosyltransferase [Verrucomicrobia subdivision 3 bacterium]|nr:Cob(I)yrinic acid a,c-diamide adenosyltransferase [Limisphaerales bacterium]MCS1412371.1 Cob(I)yrinic acid a,c-diamide adenosyltransferase [Limisphaerales bacterium]